MNFYMASFFILLSSFAGATEQKNEPAQKSVDDLVKLEFSKEFCRRIITEHRPKSDVMYQAGIDVDGQTVVPADLNAFNVPVPKKIRIPITIHKQYRAIGAKRAHKITLC